MEPLKTSCLLLCFLMGIGFSGVVAYENSRDLDCIYIPHPYYRFRPAKKRGDCNGPCCKPCWNYKTKTQFDVACCGHYLDTFEHFKIFCVAPPPPEPFHEIECQRYDKGKSLKWYNSTCCEGPGCTKDTAPKDCCACYDDPDASCCGKKACINPWPEKKPREPRPEGPKTPPPPTEPPTQPPPLPPTLSPPGPPTPPPPPLTNRIAPYSPCVCKMDRYISRTVVDFYSECYGIACLFPCCECNIPGNELTKDNLCCGEDICQEFGTGSTYVECTT